MKTLFASVCLLLSSFFSCQQKESGFETLSLYCRSGKRSKKAARILSGKGFQVYELGTGFNGWVKAGRTVEK